MIAENYRTNRVAKRSLIACFMLLTLAALPFSSARAEQSTVRIMMDWIIGSTHTPFIVAREKGYFKDAGVTVEAIDPGKGRHERGCTGRGRRLPVRLGGYAFDDRVQREEPCLSTRRRVCQLRTNTPGGLYAEGCQRPQAL